MAHANYQLYWNFDILYLPYLAFNFTKIDWIRLYPYKKKTLVSQFFPLYRTHEIGQETGFSERCLRSFLLFQLPGKRITLFPLLHSMCYPSQQKLFYLSFKAKFSQSVARQILPLLFQTLRTTVSNSENNSLFTVLHFFCCYCCWE